jgi:hypothetical protein
MISIIGLGTAGGDTAQVFGTLAATGMGALAGAVTIQFGKDETPPDGGDDTTHEGRKPDE